MTCMEQYDSKQYYYIEGTTFIYKILLSFNTMMNFNIKLIRSQTCYFHYW